MGSSFFSFSRPFLKCKEEYRQLEDGDDKSSEEELPAFLFKSTPPYNRKYLCSICLNIILSAALVLSLVNSMIWQMKSNRELIKETSSICKSLAHELKCTTLTFLAPILDHVPLSMSLQVINGSFMSETTPPDIFRALPSPEVDEAWHDVGTPTWITITEDEAHLLGKDTSVLVRAPEEWGHGSDRYIAMLDLNHQLHCIDQLRRAAFRSDYPIDLEGPRGDYHKEHWMHCVHILKQNVMCTGSTEVITYNWVETQRFPMPDFSVEKMCRNSQLLLDLQEREKITNLNKKREAMVRPEDAIVLPLPPRLKAFLDAHDD